MLGSIDHKVFSVIGVCPAFRGVFVMIYLTCRIPATRFPLAGSDGQYQRLKVYAILGV